MRAATVAGLVLFVVGIGLNVPARADAGDPPDKPAAAEPGLYVKVLLSTAVKMSSLKPGDVVEGTLSRDVYSANHKVFSSGSHVRLTVNHLERRKRTRNDHWPWVVNVFTPRHENYPVFREAVVNSGTSDSRIQVSLLSVSRVREVCAHARKNKSGQSSAEEQGAVEVSTPNQKKPATPTMVLEAFGMEASQGVSSAESDAVVAQDKSDLVPAGTRCKILLLGSVSASQSKPGDVVAARLLEPVVLNSRVALPAGSLITGKVLKRTPPRMLSRAGSLYLSFTELTLPEGSHLTISASPAGAELNEKSHTRIDAEGGLHGERPGKVWMAINLGMTAGITKEVDDGLQLVIEAIVSTATDVSTAGTGRIVAGCVSGLYLATRHGRDVVLPRFSEMDITLERPVSLDSRATIAASNAAAGGK
ncbi:MAG TPA: hypothetical protein VE377_21245 [Candidatus Dormibacteraeota bacterium]|nr:hypothetical protein [Candidatus Dormibacteraeota bacterium]